MSCFPLKSLLYNCKISSPVAARKELHVLDMMERDSMFPWKLVVSGCDSIAWYLECTHYLDRDKWIPSVPSI